MGQAIKWDSVMKAAMSMPGVKVDRAAFLAKSFGPFSTAPVDFSTKRPTDIYPPEVIDYLAKNVIKNHTSKVTLISTAAGMPGGLAMIGTIPADFAQFYWHFLVMAQKLAYLYGWPDMTNPNNELDEGAQSVLTVFVGVALGANGATAVVKEIAEQAAKYWAKKLPQQVLTKTALHPVIAKIASFLGIKLTKDSMGKAVGKVIPLVGGIVSGTLTFVTFKPMADKLNKTLKESRQAFAGVKA